MVSLLFYKDLLFSGDHSGRVLVWKDRKARMPKCENSSIKSMIPYSDNEILVADQSSLVRALNIETLEFRELIQYEELFFDLSIVKNKPNHFLILNKHNEIIEYDDGKPTEFRMKLDFKSNCLASSDEYIVIGDIKGNIYVYNYSQELLY